MSKEHVDAYYKEVCQNYIEMNEAIKDMEDECNKGLVDPDKLEEMKKMVEPLKNNYMTLSYIMFLFNKPKRKKKEKKYIQQNKKLLNNIPEKNTKEGIIQENKQVISSIKNLK